MDKAPHETLLKRNRPQPGWFKQNEVSLKSLIEKGNAALPLKISRPTRSSSQRWRKIRKDYMKKLYERVPIYERSVLQLLYQEPVISGVDYPPTDEEILKAVNSRKNNAPGELGLTYQMFKAIVSNN